MHNGKATGNFLGKIEVARDAQKTDAEQSFKGMLLDRGATANCKPELEIFADDVKCAHGAAVGELDAEAALLRQKPRARPGERPRAAARRLRHGPVGRRWRTASDPRSGPRRVAEGRRMNAPTAPSTPQRPRCHVRGEFPAIAGWHYLDSAATAQKPQAVIDAITEAYARDYATVHRGVTIARRK